MESEEYDTINSYTGTAMTISTIIGYALVTLMLMVAINTVGSLLGYSAMSSIGYIETALIQLVWMVARIALR